MSNFSGKDLALLSDRNQKIKTRKISILAIVFTTLLFLGGCGMLNMFTESYEDIRDEMLQHLYEKYGIEFTGDSLERGSHDYLIAFPTDGNKHEDFVRMRRHAMSDGVVFYDTFFGVIIRDDLEARVTAALADIGLPVKVFFPSNNTYFNNIFDGTKTFEDFNQWVADGNNFNLRVTIFFEVDSAECFDTYANHAIEKIKETGYMLNVIFHFTPTEIFEQIIRNNRTDIIARYRNEITSITNIGR